MKESQPAGEVVPPRKGTVRVQAHIGGAASGWVVAARFGPGGVRCVSEGPSIRVVAVNPRRGTGSSPEARLGLLRRAVERTSETGPTVYLTSAGFIGCAAPEGDRTKDFYWPGGLDLQSIDRRLCDLAARLPPDALVCVGVEDSWEDEAQRLWLYAGGVSARVREIVRADTTLQWRSLQVAGFRLLAFVCGELWDGGGGFDPANAEGVDVVLDAAHGSVNRVWDRAAEPWPRCAFQRAFLKLGNKCGAVLAQAHEAERQTRQALHPGLCPPCGGQGPRRHSLPLRCNKRTGLPDRRAGRRGRVRRRLSGGTGRAFLGEVKPCHTSSFLP